MKRKSVLFIAFAMLMAGGCAKQEMLKKDEMIPPAASSGSTGSGKDASTIKETPVKSEPVREASIGDKSGEANAGDSAALSAGSLETIYFDFDSYLLSPAAREILVRNAQKMKAKGGMRIRIEGNCDERGSDEYNLALGEKRAKSAMQYIISLGVPANRLSVISYGKEKPADSGNDDGAWAKNRRDEFVVSAK